MIHLAEITEENWLEAAGLSVRPEQIGFLAPAIGILARGYVYRGCHGRVFLVRDGETAVGLLLVRDFTEEPLGYDLQQFMIDRRFQGRGFGREALRQILALMRAEGRFDRVEVCVKRENRAALGLFSQAGVVDSGYVDEELPDCVNLVLKL